MIAAPLRQEARGLIERARRCSRPMSAAPERVSEAWRGGSRRSKLPWGDLQDAVQRGFVGQDDELAELRKRPALSQMARALSDDVRGRGI